MDEVMIRLDPAGINQCMGCQCSGLQKNNNSRHINLDISLETKNGTNQISFGPYASWNMVPKPIRVSFPFTEEV